ncbi:MAG: ChaN family lipoprotein [Candidatus Didemnitutus sp.]|nr:ChaN family lipoprotein [Candidatus Didemnitutus sp.]
MKKLLPLALVFAGLALSTATSARAGDLWLDLIEGEETNEAAVLTDLVTAGVIYVGEAHTIDRHHAIQLHLFQALAARGVSLALCLEQLEARDQPALDRFNRGELSFDEFAAEITWAKKWKNFADYRALCEFAQQNGIPVRALNAPSATIRAVSRGGGLANLPADQRALLADEIVTDDPVYERLMNLTLAVHMAMDPAKLRPVFEAQVARDETMAAHIIAARHTDAANGLRTAFVIVGAGHVRHGLGTADRVRRREPGIAERIILMTESGQLVLTESDKAASREISISHADLRAIGRPPGDYLLVLPLSRAEKPAAK